MNEISIVKILKGIYQIEDIDWENFYDCYTKSEFCESEYKSIYREFPNFDWLIYYYGNGDYEGSGEMIIKQKDNKYYVFSLSHCSCYGPTENISLDSKYYKSIDEILENSSKEYIEKELYPILKFIKCHNKIFKEEGQWLKKIKN